MPFPLRTSTPRRSTLRAVSAGVILAVTLPFAGVTDRAAAQSAPGSDSDTDSDTDADTHAETETETEAPRLPEDTFGVFLGSGPEGILRADRMRNWLGGTEMRVGRTYLPGDRWSNIEGRPEFLRPWAHWRSADPERLFVLNVPMLDRNEEGISDREVRHLLRAGAAGQFDHHFRVLAERLVELGLPDTVIVLGWEMNGTTYTHRCGPDPVAWKSYWRSIVTAMRAVPGQEFRFDFAPNRGVDAIGWAHCYPGDDVVDIVGLDSYDQPPGENFDDQVKQPYGLQDHVDFAAARGKPISFPEWGLFRNGDNPEYMRRMLEWIAEHQPVYHSISDYCPHGVWWCGHNSRSSEVFRDVLSRPDTEDPADG
ncbi:glycoside hydrolase family 26 protein [Streptomyces otsuchiensis]|uniref:glycoside hydrolase family 26 protein n=1 Tax=Streptomyces otsuchiensis TaxID=2681388 RepID=UPI0010314CA0|nr:glycosyl hydrolase [Streptomyces otsuchiensis]